MNEGYTSQRASNRWVLPIIVILVVVGIILGAIFLIGRSQFVSPVPKQPSFSVIYYTPTPAAATPTSSPSATPKVTKAPTRTPAPTKAESTPSASVTPKTTLTPTLKPTT